MTQLAIFSVLFCLVPFIFASSTDGNSNCQGVEKRLNHFRISNAGASYYHEPTDSYHQLIQERFHLYAMLAEVSNSIEELNLETFEASLTRHKESIGFCARFHIVFLILNRYSRSVEDLAPFVGMIEALKRLEIAENPNDIVMNQFYAFSDRITALIKEFEINGLRDAAFSATLKDFLEAEIGRILCL